MAQMQTSSSSPSLLNDADLARAAQRGEKRAFVEIVARHQAVVCGVALGILGEFALAEDAAQEAFVTAWRRIQDLREPEKLRAWLIRIARNTALGQRRRTREFDPLTAADDPPDEDPTPDGALVSDEEAALVREALERLPELLRLPMVLFYRQEQSVREVAEALELSEDAVKQRLARGREILRDRLSGVIERTLRVTRPNAVFTMTVAAAIGALMAPAALAAGVFSAATAAGSGAAAGTTAGTSTTPAITAMTTTKASLTTAAVVAAACLPLGYAVHFGPDTAPSEAPAPIVRKAPVTPRPPDFSDSALFAEWRRLHDEHGHDATAMPALFDAIGKVKDPFRRRAFRSALVAEWAQVDPSGGFRFFLKKSNSGDQRSQLFGEWLEADPAAAVAALDSAGEEGEKVAAAFLSEIARHAPGAVPALAARLKTGDSYWTHPVADAFTILAEKGLDSARQAAEAMTGPLRSDALCGVAKTWALSDMEGALKWAKSISGEADRDEIIRQVLIGRAGVEAATALDQLELVPAGGRPGYFASTTGARVLAAAAEKDFAGTLAWMTQHPGRLSRDDLMGMASAVGRRINADPEGFFQRAADAGTLSALLEPIGSAILNDSGHNQERIWEWLRHQPENAATTSLRQSLLNAAGYQNPTLAMKIAAQQPDTPQGRANLDQLASSLLNGGSHLDRFDQILPAAPANLRQSLAAESFRFLSADTLTDPRLWVERLALVPESNRLPAVASLAGAWTDRRPTEAAAWATQLNPEAGRTSAIESVVRTWAQRDSLSASDWVRHLPPGADRETGSAALVQSVARDAPDEALQWALTISDPSRRAKAIRDVADVIAQRSPDTFTQWIDRAPLTPADKAGLQRMDRAPSRPADLPQSR